jgi:Delta3-Delta2-enoyl-CoA isomerase
MRRCYNSLITLPSCLTTVASTTTSAFNQLAFFHNGPPRGGQFQQQGGQFQQQQRRGAPPQDFYDDDPSPAAPRRRGQPGGGGQQQQMMSREEEMIMMRQQQQMMRHQAAAGQQQGQVQQRGGGRQQIQQMQEADYEEFEGDDQGVMEGGAEEQQAPPEPPKKPEEQKLVSIEDNVDGTGVTVIRMRNKPVNSLSLELLKELNAWMLWLGAAENVKGVVLSSEIPLVFSAGLDLKEFVDAKPENFKVYWRTFQETYLILHTFPRPLIAAITGNSPAGGCVISLCCDHRIMAKHPKEKADKPYRIGLNETKLGLVAPPWVMQSCAYVIGQRKAERMLTLGETPTAEEAEKLGLVDLACDQDDVVPQAVKEAAKMASVSEEARWMTKDMMRRPLIELFASPEDREYDADFFASLVTAEPVQKSLKEYVAKLGGAKKQ